MRTAKDLEVLRIERLVAAHWIKKAWIVHDATADVARAQKATGLAKILSMFRNDGLPVILRRMERVDDALALAAPNLLVAQVFEKRLAVDQAKGGLFQQGRLRAPKAGRDLAHQSGMLTLPNLKCRRALQKPSGDQLFVG